jgi:hypothetical protein
MKRQYAVERNSNPGEPKVPRSLDAEVREFFD